MSAPPRSKITMQTWIATAVKMPAESPTFDRSLTYFFYFLHPIHFFFCCNLHNKFLHICILKHKMPKRKGGKTVYSATEAGEMVCMNSDSEGDEINLGEDLDKMSISSDYEDDLQFDENNTDNDDEDPSSSPPAKKGNLFLLANKKCLHNRVRKNVINP